MLTKDVLVRIGGVQAAVGSESENMEVITAGRHYLKNGKHYILYEEVMEGFSEPTYNTVKIMHGRLEIIKKGVVKAYMVFEPGKRHIADYVTPYGGFTIGIDTNTLTIEESEECIIVNTDYMLELNYEHHARCSIVLEAASRQSGSFTIS